MDNRLRQNYIRAKRLIDDFRNQIGKVSLEERDRLWHELVSNIQKLGFSSTEDVFIIERQYPEEVIEFIDASPKRIKFTLREELFQEEVILDSKDIENTVYIWFPKSNGFIVHRDKADSVNIEECKRRGLNIYYKVGVNTDPIPFGKGQMLCGLAVKGFMRFPANPLTLVFRDMITSLGYKDVVISHPGCDLLTTSIEISGKQVAGCSANFKDVIAFYRGHLNFNLDLSLFSGLGADEIMGKIGTLKVDESSIRQQLSKSVEKLVGRLL